MAIQSGSPSAPHRGAEGAMGALRIMLDAPVVPVVDAVDGAWLLRVAQTVERGGIRAFEVTLRREGARTAFETLAATLNGESPLMLGAGSVPDTASAHALMDAGARFIVTPFLDHDMAHACAERDVLYVPGIMTPTEAREAHQLGVPLVKLFPASTVGPAHLKSILAPMPYLRVMPTGGIAMDEDSLVAWATAGASIVGLGSNLVPSSLASDADLSEVERHCRRALGIIREHRHRDRADVA